MSYDYARGVHVCNGCGSAMPSFTTNPPYVAVTRVCFNDRQHGIGGGLTFCERCEPGLMAVVERFCRAGGGAITPSPSAPPEVLPPGTCRRCRHTSGKHLQSCPDNPAR